MQRRSASAASDWDFRKRRTESGKETASSIRRPAREEYELEVLRSRRARGYSPEMAFMVGFRHVGSRTGRKDTPKSRKVDKATTEKRAKQRRKRAKGKVKELDDLENFPPPPPSRRRRSFMEASSGRRPLILLCGIPDPNRSSSSDPSSLSFHDLRPASLRENSLHRFEAR